ncbi:MAG: hypothetical protein COC01_01190 [Bacteroidetes bacterium]|nr:MAG: hypothetical protein COC01_01190 [Bacteroidota bacterium]
MKKLIFLFLAFFLFFLSVHTSIAQDRDLVDSLEVALLNTEVDTIKVRLLVKLGVEYGKSDPDKRLEYGLKAKELAEKTGYTFGVLYAFKIIAQVYTTKGELDKAMEIHQERMKISRQLNKTDEIIGSYNSIGENYRQRGEYQLALKNYLLGLKLCDELSRGSNSKNRLKTHKGWFYNNMALVYGTLGNPERALEFHEKSLEISNSMNNDRGKAITYNNMAIIYLERGDLEISKNYFMQAVRLQEKLGNKEHIALAYGNAGEIYTELGKLDTAIFYQKKSLKMREELGDRSGLLYSLGGMALIHQKKGELQQAVSYLEKSIEIGREINAKKELYFVFETMADVYKEMGDFKKSVDFFEKSIVLKDSMINENSAKTVQEMQAKYDADRTEKEIEMLKNENELKELRAEQQESSIRKHRNVILLFICILGLMLSMGYIINTQYRYKKQANKELEEMNIQLEIKNKSIAESINYAQRIQETIMPTQKHLQEVFPESFIFYKAKDVVSGDFPWVMKNDKNFFAATVDCTGHGVPGAMMSMIGYFLLNDIVGGKNIHDPSEILGELHEGIKHTLRQEENIESKDGMDIALCSINKEKREVHYAGAHRSLLWFHDGIIKEIRGNRFPVGGLQYSSRGKEIKFTNHKLQLAEGDSIFFYSDGLIDQVGGPKGRRFQNDQVKEIIIENKDKSMDELKVIFNDQFINWMGSEKQLDDVIMMGIKV